MFSLGFLSPIELCFAYVFSEIHALPHLLTTYFPLSGDGATDMEARPPADIFVGFGGNVIREKVKGGADWFVTSRWCRQPDQ